MIVVVRFLLHAWLLCFFSQRCRAGDTLNAGDNIQGSETILTSAGQQFELGFFSPPESITSGTGRYLGIWYFRERESEPKTVVWVANRDHPIAADSTGVFEIAEDGNLVVVDTYGRSYWSSKLVEGSTSLNRSVKLMDSGNLVLVDDHLGKNLWESFQEPTDTFLPGMDMDNNLELTCWRGLDDPGSGNFTFKMSQKLDKSFSIYNQGKLYWESEKQGLAAFNSEEGGDDMTIEVYRLLTNFSDRRHGEGNPNLMDYRNTRLMINSTGVVQFVFRNNLLGESIKWMQPKTKCLIYNACGEFASCNDNLKVCKCLPGFDPVLPSSPAQNGYIGEEGDYLQAEGCARKSASCRNDTTTFLNLVMMKIGNPDKRVSVANQLGCQSTCLRMCPQCQAYSYTTPRTRRELSPTNCWIWTKNLTTLKEESLDGDGLNLSVRVDKSDIAPTPKTCEPCGTIVVPYPLSTGESCGDPTYFKFSCNISTGQLIFTPTNHSYRVTRMEPESRKFLVQVIPNIGYNRYCGEKPGNSENLQVSSPFEKTSDSQCAEQVGVTWQPPSEPICAKSIDCHGWKHSTCNRNRCHCNAKYYWHGDLLSCTEKAISPFNPTPEEPTRKGNSKSSLSLILGITLPGVVILACAIIFACVCRHKIALKQDRENIQRNRRHFYDSERHVKDLIDMEGLEEKDNEGIEVPYFDFESILIATNYFSNANKLGKGGYGPVYKGTLPGGQDIAVKRLSSVLSQGLQEFKNEVILIAKLQHRNLVRLRGYCIKGDEKILLYEYMPNKSLDSFIFDPTQSILLDWPMRFDIILGIARGLLYLHQDSRLRVIHRDLKSSNILLDGEMQPKISDFGLARIFAGKETEANTERVVGTYGYMSPEYALDGLFSTKSDVFSFGVVLLEIIIGKKNTGFYQSKEVLSLLGYAWSLWTENKLLDLMDLSLRETCNANQCIRCAHIGLLCVQDEPDDRPTMSNVAIMLESETAALPTPKQPTFFTRKDLSSTASSSSKAVKGLQFESSIQEGR